MCPLCRIPKPRPLTYVPAYTAYILYRLTVCVPASPSPLFIHFLAHGHAHNLLCGTVG